MCDMIRQDNETQKDVGKTHMSKYSMLRQRVPLPTTQHTANATYIRYLLPIMMSLLVIMLTACGGSDPGVAETATPAPARVNGFGTAANHPHALLALSDKVLLLATHYGLFRTEDSGT